MITKKLREIRDGGEAEYQLTPPITLTIIGEVREITHIISSHAYAMRAGLRENETMIFQSDGNGNIVSQVDLYHMPGHVDHDEAVQSFWRSTPVSKPRITPTNLAPIWVRKNQEKK